MVDAARARKLADRIKVVVAETLEMRVKDPRLGFITITDVRMTGDLQQVPSAVSAIRSRGCRPFGSSRISRAHSKPSMCGI